MAHSGNRPLRKLMFEAYYGRASPTVDRLNRNVENIVEITRKRYLVSQIFHRFFGLIPSFCFRRLIAKFLGYSCYADIILQSKMVRTKENVQNFIETIRSKLKPIHDEEIRQLTAYAQEKSTKTKEYDRLQAWDVSYWRHQHARDLASSLKIDPAQISRHFSYDHVQKGLFRFVENLFGVQFEVDNSIDDEYKWHPDVQVYRCVENGRAFPCHSSLT